MRRVWREVSYLALTGFLGGLGLAYALAVVALGLPLAASVVGLPVLGLAVVSCRKAGEAQRALVGGLLETGVVAPLRFRPRSGLRGWTGSALGDLAGWRALAYLLVRGPVVVVGAVAAVLGGGAGAVMVAYPLWRVLDVGSTDGRATAEARLQVAGWNADSWPRSLLVAVAGAALLVAACWLVRAVVAVDRRLVQALLTPTGREEHILESRRATAQMASTQLRLLDEDLDAPPARGDADPMAAPDLDLTVAEGGLGPSLAVLARHAPLPIRLHLDLNRTDLAPELEAVAHMGARVLVANVVEHSGAGLVEVSLTAGQRSLMLRVSDDGRGGAASARGSGLDRLARRISCFDGLLVISSPPGGPTDITLALPLPTAPSRPGGVGPVREGAADGSMRPG